MTTIAMEELKMRHKTASDLFISIRERMVNINDEEAMEQALELSVKFMNKFKNYKNDSKAK